ncbi:T9SS type A sorting domain-containing protein [Fulvivirgaceae bacterium BMA10]|uniref:T9SS type A sorting domain-containing protein n=1 Tax=Splendidivirga corallicola TaxID=3051826 RepID=A0ABT8KNA1_9BACT|nr:T9SS type A sorting domain-containing protein [Fulvivirgaceae bacterium BMA10]
MTKALSICKISIAFFLCLSPLTDLKSQSIAREWNEALLEGIRNDYARPTIHARNLFHISAAMYDAWAAYNTEVSTYFLGQEHNGQLIPFEGVSTPANIESSKMEALSFACYRLIKSRYQYSPGVDQTFEIIDDIMIKYGYDIHYEGTDYVNGTPADLGNYIAAQIIEFGFGDGSNEKNDYANLFYSPVNNALALNNPLELNENGDPGIMDPNRWQPLAFDTFIDQAGNEIPGNTPEFLSPEWGNVIPFSLEEKDKVTYNRNNSDYYVYHDPDKPAYIQGDGKGDSDEYKWNFSLVSIWGAHLDSNESTLWDISPASIGNLDIEEFPQSIVGLREFYDYLKGGDHSTGYDINPKTGQPYAPQMVKRGDYARVLAEFWADGPDSETPPGHWFTILNYVNDHPQFEKRFKGEGKVLGDLEWDVKSYFALAGAMHDAAISAWGIKGYYDYIRPISAIRYMAFKGQSTDVSLPSYHVEGIPLVDGYIELVNEADELAGENNEHVGKIKLYTWRGHNFIADPETDMAGVGWILAQNWMPYQRPTFVTPPFAGYVSGHSTYSRAAAKVLTLLTGDEYFPGGVGEFVAKKNEFLVFEEGPSEDIILQWAKYYDASDQCSLSRIWGGIHPPVDDVPGRLIGDKIGATAFALAEKYFNGEIITTIGSHHLNDDYKIFPNPNANGRLFVQIKREQRPKLVKITIKNLANQIVESITNAQSASGQIEIDVSGLSTGCYILNIRFDDNIENRKIMIE